jgi:heavy metal translocating P-type ATPase
MITQRFSVTGMSCAACSARVEKAVRPLPGVARVQVNLLTHSMQVQYDEAQQTEAGIIAAVERAGYGASPGAPGSPQDTSIRNRLIYSFLCLLPMVALHHFLPGGWSTAAQFLLLFPILILNRRFFISGTKAVAQRAPNMDTLVSLGATMAILYSLLDMLYLHSGTIYVESAAMILTFITLGKWLESRATGRTGEALRKLKALLPKNAMVLRSGSPLLIPANEVETGDVLMIAPGERIPVDAIVTEGCSAIDDSSLTGESIPVLKQTGSCIYAGTINGNGTLQAIARCTCAESSLSQVIHLVGEAAATKAPVARLADQMASLFVPVVIGIAMLTALAWLLCGATLSFALGCAIAVLVISCPCALGLATPVAIMVGAGRGTEHGILFRDGCTMENASRINAIILDKTGTLTSGKPTVRCILPAEGISRNTLLQLAATLEQNNTHPLACCIRQYTDSFAAQQIEQLQYLPGRGVRAVLNGEEALAGNAELMREHNIAVPVAVPPGLTPLFFAQAGHYMGLIGVADSLKPGSAEAVKWMQNHGLRVLMMSGDNEATVRSIACQAGIELYYAGVTPQEKEEMVRRLQTEGYCVAMVGDGINDAPALTRADVGIAIGAGTDVAIESSGIILTRSELMDAAGALELGRAVIRTIRQNLFWALLYNILAIPLAAGALYPATGLLLNPGVAAAAMSLSSLCVVGNALRLRHIQLPKISQNQMNTTSISVEGMMCPHCERHVVQAICALPGVTEATADHKTASVSITSETPLDEALLAETITRAGYEYKGIR